MSEDEKKNEGQKRCCCCQCFKAIFMAIVLLVIGAAIGHVMTIKCCPMMGHLGGHGMKTCWDRGEMGRECGLENKFEEGKEICSKEKGGWFGQKDDFGKCKPGCTCPRCTKMRASMQEPNKPVCPMMEQKSK
jgi:hypothetical protein